MYKVLFLYHFWGKWNILTTVTEANRNPQEIQATMENVRRQLQTYGKEIQEYLSRVEANVEGYKFSVEKHGDGIEVDVEFKALIHPKLRAGISK